VDAAHIDFETRSPTDLRKSGVYVYAEDPQTDIWGFSWRIGFGPVNRWRPGYPDPIELLNHIAAGGIVVAHGAAFERRIWNYILRRHVPHWPLLTPQQQDCTMARAAAISHPQDLDKLCRALNTTEVKDRDGHNLMMKMARPRKYHPDGRIEWWDSPADVERLTQYQDQDVRTESEVDTKLPPLSDKEREVWLFDQIVNDRGIYIDENAVNKCAEMVEYAKKAADSEMRKLTGRVVPKCSNDGKLIEFIQARGIECTTVKKSVQDDLMFMADLKDDAVVRAAIELRKASKKTSTAKYKSFLECICHDHRVRGLLNYHGASTGRWAGRLVQPQNFPRVDSKKYADIIKWMHEMLELYDAKSVFDTVCMIYGDDYPLKLLSVMLRSMIKAAPGNKLIGGDFSNIEGRLNAWFANETWKLQAFREYDAGTGPDLYKLAYAKSFGVTVEEVDELLRQIGKVEELALGYQGSVGAFITMGDTYGVNPYDISGPVYKATSSHQWDMTALQYHKKGTHKHNLQEREWTAIKIVVDNFRAANPNIVQSWWGYQDAAVQAVSAPGTIVQVAQGKVSYYSDGRCLWCVLPAGRMLCYSSPTVETEIVEMENDKGETYTRTRYKVAFWGMDSKTKQWGKQYLYGGLQCENIVSGTARDVMVDRMFAVERANYPIILTVHDELLSEVSKDNVMLNDRDYERIMSEVPYFVQGLPLAAKAWGDERYIK